MKTGRHIVVAAFAAVLVLSSLARATDVSGNITTTTWTKANSPYRVKGAIEVVLNNILTIEPGVDVLFDADVKITAYGLIRATGTAADSIRFLKGTAAEWGGISVTSSGTVTPPNDSSAFAYVRISGAKNDGSPGYGGAIGLSQTNLKLSLDHCVLSGNTAATEGGAVSVDNGAILYARNCLFANNTSPIGGGISFRANTTYGTISDCVFQGNTSATDGCAIGSRTPHAAFTRCLITGNTHANNTSTVDCFSGSNITMVNCTIANNTTTKVFDSTSGGKAALRNCIVWGTGTVMLEAPLPGTSDPWTVTYSDIKGSWTGTGNINADPLFINAAAGDFTLGTGSPCINTGDPADPTDPDGSRVDMGAYPTSGSTAVLAPATLARFALYANAPNPFNPATTIRFDLPSSGFVTLAVYDINGRLVRNLLVGLAASAARTFPAGQHSVTWDGCDNHGRAVASGVYLVRLTAPEGVLTGRMVLLR
ncbi:MAG TPA: FlgD immunoglobulin-like domain containing protein [Candidatus Latescibacteria bacterium]|nr:FlgD immunoglobulin-like domain containing protein [Candidatus Latescibacterota bacterium]